MNTQKSNFIPWLLPCTPGFLILLGTRMTFLGIFLLFGAAIPLCYHLVSLLEEKHPFAARNFRKILTAVVALVLVVTVICGSLVWMGTACTAEAENDYVLLLGCAVWKNGPSPTLQERINTACTYLQEHPDAICIVTGGKGSDEVMSEAQCMFDALTAMGIPSDRIWMENRATSTVENLQYSTELILEKTGKKPTNITIISSETHLFRAGMMAKNLGLAAAAVPAPTNPWLLRVNNGLREIAAIWIYLITGG